MTAQQIINAALLNLGEIAAGETPTSEESDDALRVLNNLIDSWSAEQLAIPYLTVDSFSLTGSESYAIGAGQTFNSARPLSVKAALVKTAGGASAEAEIVSAERWAQIRDRSRTGVFAEVLYYVGGAASGTIYLSPIPGSGTLELHSYKELTQFATLATDVTLPAGHARALEWALALDLSPQYGRDPGVVAGPAKQAREAIAQLNVTAVGLPRSVEQPPAPPGGAE